MLARIIIQPTSNEVPCRLLNVSNRTKTIRAYEKLATIEKIYYNKQMRVGPHVNKTKHSIHRHQNTNHITSITTTDDIIKDLGI